MKVVTASEMQEIDRITIEEYGLPGEVLMNSAGMFVAGFVNEKFPGCAVNIICGTGNNGGDGFTAAYYLRNTGCEVKVILCGPRERVLPVSRIYMNLCDKSGVSIIEVKDTETLAGITFNPGIIIDSVFGTGFRGTPGGLYRDIICRINSSGLKVISVDIPSGLSSDGEIPSDIIVKADFTVTIGLPKINIATYPGKSYCGEIVTADIGFPAILTQDDRLKVDLLDRAWFDNYSFFNEHYDMHKGSRGHVLLIGGFEGMEGAILLTASSLFKTGTGLATVATSGSSRIIIAGKIPELMTAAIPDYDHESWFHEFFGSRKFSSIIIGPGLGRSVNAGKVFRSAVDMAATAGIRSVLIDGDGLYHLASYLNSQKLPQGPVYCITPHFMEASRILGTGVDEISKNRLKYCKELASLTGCVTVLKGPATVISDCDRAFINPTGNSLLATAGSGDVLSGIIASFLAGKNTAISAACAGVYVHGLCADLHREKINRLSMSANDIIVQIPAALASTFGKKD